MTYSFHWLASSVLLLCSLLNPIFLTGRREAVIAYPKHTKWASTELKMKDYISTLHKNNVPVKNRNLVIFHIGELKAMNTLDVAINNVKIFVSALQNHTDTCLHKSFYLFNVVRGRENPLMMYLPLNEKNVGLIEWNHAASDILDTHLRTVNIIGKELIDEYAAVFFFNQDVRGPLVNRENGRWIIEFRKLLDENNVGMVGPTISCELSPHVQTHAFVIRSSIISNIIALPGEGEMTSAFVQKLGYNISSILYNKRYQQPYFNGYCAPGCGSPIQPTLNPISWCTIVPSDVIFMDWGGEPMRIHGFLCQEAVAMMRNTLADFSEEHPELDLIVPETLIGGFLYELYKEYNEELWRDRVKKINISDSEPKVCFFVRTASMHDMAEEVRSRSRFIEMDMGLLLESLLRQVNPNWLAFFFVTDTIPFDDRLEKLLRSYRDPRLKHIKVDPSIRIPFNRVDAGYTVTDYILNKYMSYPACKWISVTNGDNVYGSEVVHRVLNVPPNVVTGKMPKLLLNPLDSRNFANADFQIRHNIAKSPHQWSDYCLCLEAMLLFNLLAYTIQPTPQIGRVDLAAVFLSRDAYAAENVHFGNFTNLEKYPCVGCQDGYLTQYLVQKRRWTYYRLGIDGLKSIVFHGPSPTWCIASGNVWFDHPDVNQVGCLSHSTVRMLNQIQKKYYDWHHHDLRDRVCLRLSKFGYYNETE